MKRVRTFAFGLCLIGTALHPSAAEASGTRARVRPLPSCGRGLTVWQIAANSRQNTACGLLDRARANLMARPQAAILLTQRAQALIPHDGQLMVIQAHALLLMGDTKGAHELFLKAEEAMRLSTVSGLLPVVHRVAAARAAALTANYERAHLLYRQIVLHLDELPDVQERARILIEAGTAASYSGQQGYAEARGYLRRAQEQHAPLLEPIVTAAIILLTERTVDQTWGGAKIAIDPALYWSLLWIDERVPSSLGRPSEVFPVLPKGERAALLAAVARIVEPAQSPLHQKRYEEEGGDAIPPHMRRSGYVAPLAEPNEDED